MTSTGAQCNIDHHVGTPTSAVCAGLIVHMISVGMAGTAVPTLTRFCAPTASAWHQRASTRRSAPHDPQVLQVGYRWQRVPCQRRVVMNVDEPVAAPPVRFLEVEPAAAYLTGQ